MRDMRVHYNLLSARTLSVPLEKGISSERVTWETFPYHELFFLPGFRRILALLRQLSRQFSLIRIRGIGTSCPCLDM